MLISGVSAIWGMRHSSETPWQLFLVWVGIYALLLLVLDSRWKAFQRRGA
jgi:hypothetical protein